MPSSIELQQNGLFRIWSTIVDDYIVREKKALVIDLKRSWNGYIVSVPQGENGARQSIQKFDLQCAR